jgi:hypothetical protein
MKNLCLSIFLLLVSSCTQKTSFEEKEWQQNLDSLGNTMPLIDQESVLSVLQQIPSPLEISMLLKQSGARYNHAILNRPDNISRYHSNYKKALNLGIYGADLGYTNIFGENVEGIRYLASIKGLANDLNIGQFFNVATISRLATNSNNLDSLLLVTTQSFNSINQHLQDQNRSNLSVLLLIGGWIEAMEIICRVASENMNNRELIDRIGEQKIVLEQLVLLLSFYKYDPNMATLYQNFDELKAIFDGITITFTHVESTVEVINGVAVIKDNSTSSIMITETDVRNITYKINSIRTDIIN